MSDHPDAKAIFSDAMELPPGEREALVRQRCAGNQELLLEVLELIEMHGRAGALLDKPTVDPALPHAPNAGPGAGGGRGLFRPAGPRVEEPGDQIGPYKLLGILGEGGFGIVYLAERREPHVQRVALKVIKPGMDSKAVVARFEAERQALALMDHPNVAKVFDAGTTPSGRPYFVMEHVQGEPITAYCDKHTLATRDRLALFVHVCEAVQHAHHKGIIHRDIKPSNILVGVKDGKPIPKVIDFGVAKAISRQLTEKSIFTELGQLIGTPEYMSPEQAEMGAIDIDTRTDVYSLGVVLYELLTGAVPFDSKTLRSAGYDEIRRIIREQDPPRPSTRLSAMGETAAAVAQRRHTQIASLERELRSELEWIPLKAIRKDRTQRYRTPNELADDIRNYLAGKPLIAGPESVAYKARKFLRRNRAPVGAAGAVLLALVLGLAGTLWQAKVAIAQRDRAISAEQAALSAAAESQAKSDFLINALQSAGTLGDGPRVTVATVIDRTAPTVDQRFARDPKVRLSLHEMYGRVYRSLSLHPKADEHIRAAIKVARELPKPDESRIIDLLNLLGTIQLERGRDLEASRVFHEVDTLAAKPGAGGGAPTAEQLAIIQNHLASFNWNAGDYEMAEFRFRAAIDRFRSGAPESKSLAYAEGDLGRLLVDEGFPDEAEEFIVRSLESRRRLDPEPSMSVAYGILTLGYLRHARWDLPAAAESYRASRAMYTLKLATGGKPMVAMTRMDLAGIIEDAGPTGAPFARPDDREPPFKLDDLEHMRYIAAISLRNRARILYAQRRFEDCDDRFRRSIAVDQEIAAAASPDDRAERNLSEAHTRRVWADLLRRAGRLDDAGREYGIALDLQRRAAGSDDEFLLAPTLMGMGELALARAHADEAEGHLAEAVRLRRSALGDDAWPVAIAEVAHARSLIADKKYDRAEAPLLVALKVIEKSLGPAHRRATAARDAIIAMYEAWGKSEQAAEYRARKP